VFRGEQVRWDEIGTIPFDAFGAPGWEPKLRRVPAGPFTGQPGHRQVDPARRTGHGA
jgi:hypothetical protein